MTDEEQSEGGIVKPQNKQLEFYAWQEQGGADVDLTKTVEKLLSDDDCKPYFSSQGEYFIAPTSHGCTTIPVLEFLWGLPLNNLVLAYVNGLIPGRVRITEGECTADCSGQRVTIFVKKAEDGKYVVRRIDQEVAVSYSCGSDVDQVLRYLKEGGEKPKTRSTVFGHTKGIEKADFA